jgi:hypothetical protein
VITSQGMRARIQRLEELAHGLGTEVALWQDARPLVPLEWKPRNRITVPTLGRLVGDTNPIPEPPLICRLVHGWVVVFDPLDRMPEVPQHCFAVWVPESEGRVRGRMPRSLDFEFTLPLPGGYWHRPFDPEQY